MKRLYKIIYEDYCCGDTDYISFKEEDFENIGFLPLKEEFISASSVQYNKKKVIYENVKRTFIDKETGDEMELVVDSKQISIEIDHLSKFKEDFPNGKITKVNEFENLFGIEFEDYFTELCIELDDEFVLDNIDELSQIEKLSRTVTHRTTGKYLYAITFYSKKDAIEFLGSLKGD